MLPQMPLPYSSCHASIMSSPILLTLCIDHVSTHTAKAMHRSCHRPHGLGHASIIPSPIWLTMHRSSYRPYDSDHASIMPPIWLRPSVSGVIVWGSLTIIPFSEPTSAAVVNLRLVNLMLGLGPANKHLSIRKTSTRVS
jgi:hypothetical protein